jgi:hypothetical protein
MGKKYLSKKILFLLFIASLIFFHMAEAYTLIDSEAVSVSAKVGSTNQNNPPGEGNNLSGGLHLPSTGVNFSGIAYPYATVDLLREGVQVAEVVANSDAKFSVTLPENYDQNILYSLQATDTSGRKSLLINYPIAVHEGFFTSISGIRFAPTIITDKVEVEEGGYLTVSGSAAPGQDMQAVVSDVLSNENFSMTSMGDGSYQIIIPLQNLPKGDYTVYTKYSSDSRISTLVKFNIGDANILSIDSITSIPGDCNNDRVINLIDFSIMAFWYGKPNPPACVDTNHDGRIDLVDFSILAFYWTG